MTPALATPDTDTTLTTARTAPNAQPRTAAAGRAVPVAVSHGDGIGPEIMDATLRVLEAGGAAIDQRPITVGKAAYEAGHTSGITPEAWDTIRQTGVLLKAPITTPQGGGYKSLNVTLRKTLGLYANTRPCVAYHPFVSTRHPGMDVVIVRENEEDTYGGIEHQQTREVTQCLKLITRPGTERICRYAFAYAKAHGRKKVTCFVKDNIMKQTDGLFRKVFEEVAAEHPDIESSSMIIDIGTAKLADDPSQFDVIVTANLYGDIISDVAAEVAGSVGLVGTANIGPSSAMFEAIHGSAPDIAGKGIANPSGLLLSAVQMLVHLGQNGAAERIHNAWLRTIEDGGPHRRRLPRGHQLAEGRHGRFRRGGHRPAGAAARDAVGRGLRRPAPDEARRRADPARREDRQTTRRRRRVLRLGRAGAGAGRARRAAAGRGAGQPEAVDDHQPRHQGLARRAARDLPHRPLALPLHPPRPRKARKPRKFQLHRGNV